MWGSLQALFVRTLSWIMGQLCGPAPTPSLGCPASAVGWVAHAKQSTSSLGSYPGTKGPNLHAGQGPQAAARLPAGVPRGGELCQLTPPPPCCRRLLPRRRCCQQTASPLPRPRTAANCAAHGECFTCGGFLALRCIHPASSPVSLQDKAQVLADVRGIIAEQLGRTPDEVGGSRHWLQRTACPASCFHRCAEGLLLLLPHLTPVEPASGARRDND